jgi:hypothetical protein
MSYVTNLSLHGNKLADFYLLELFEPVSGIKKSKNRSTPVSKKYAPPNSFGSPSQMNG